MAKQVNFNGFLLRQFGAYIRTDLSALVQINGVASGIIGITGLAEKGPTNTAVTISSYTELVNTFGDGPLVRHGLAAYVGGANTLVAVRLDDAGTDNAAQSASLTVQDAVVSTDAYTFSALEAGTFGNSTSVRVVTPVIAATDVAATDTSVSGLSQYAAVNFSIPDFVASDTTRSVGSYFVVGSWNAFDTDSPSAYSQTDYSIFQWNGLTWTAVTADTLVSTITTRLGGVEESVQVPYFINELPWVKALASTTATDYYYVLKNTVTGQVREVPKNWLSKDTNEGSLDLETFEQIVNGLKSDEEVIYNGNDSVNFQLTLSSPTVFPFELIESIVNFGGFGSGSSSYVTIEADALNPVLTSLGATLLSGGTNSVDGTGWVSTAETDAGNFVTSTGTVAPTAAWDKALAVLENEEVNFVQPAYFFAEQESFPTKYSFFKALASKIVLHVNLMSNTPNRKFRTSILGLPSGQSGTSRYTAAQFLSATEDVTGTINSDRIQIWGGGFFSTALESTRTPKLYGGEWLASFAAGAHAAREVAVSLTFSALSGIFTDGLEYAWTTSQKDELYGRSIAFALKRRTSTGATEFVAAHNYTSFTGAEDKGLQLFITRRIVDYINSFIYKNLEENFIGKRSRGAQTAAEIQEFVDGLLRRLVAEGQIVAYESLRVFADAQDKTVYYVEFTFQPVTEINFILTTNRLVYNLA
jgi:hypothetical protein